MSPQHFTGEIPEGSAVCDLCGQLVEAGEIYLDDDLNPDGCFQCS